MILLSTQRMQDFISLCFRRMHTAEIIWGNANHQLLGQSPKEWKWAAAISVFKWKCKIFVFKGVYLAAELMQLMESYSRGNTLGFSSLFPHLPHILIPELPDFSGTWNGQKRIPTAAIRTGKTAMAPTMCTLFLIPLSQKSLFENMILCLIEFIFCFLLIQCSGISSQSQGISMPLGNMELSSMKMLSKTFDS